MSIATEIERLQTAKADIKSAIEEKGVTVGDGNIDTYAEKIGEISAGGGTDWLYYASRLGNVFGGVVFPENTEIVIKVRGGMLNDCSYLFNNCQNLKSVKMITETPDTILNMAAFCAIGAATTPTLELVDFSEFNKQFNNTFNMFSYQRKLKKIIGAIDLTSCTNSGNMFRYNDSLEEVEFVEGTIPIALSFASSSLLTSASIQSIIDGLADLTGSTAQKLELHSTTTANLTPEQILQIAEKNWTTE